MAILFSLLAAVLWGVGDLLSRFSARALGPWRSAFYGQVPSLLLFSACFALIPAARAEAGAAPPLFWLLGLCAALCSTLGNFSLTRGLIAGALTIVIPVTASYGAVSAVLAVLTGERLRGLEAIGIALTVLGVAGAALSPRATRLEEARTTSHRAASRGAAGIGWALGAAFSYGVTIWLQGRYVIPHLGPLPPLWITGVFSVSITFTLAKLRRHPMHPPPRRIALYTFGYGSLTACAFLCLALGLQTGQVAIVAVLSSLCSTITAILGFIVLRERLALHQWGGVGLILLGVALINAG